MDGASWLGLELSSVNLNDQRLNRRLIEVSDNMFNEPSAPIQSITGTWAKAKAAYRLFANEKLNEEIMFKAHQHETQKRFLDSKEEVYLAIQDTTKLNYTHHPKKARLGKLHQAAGFDSPVKGCLLHLTLLTNENELPLGLLEQKIYKHSASSKPSKQRPIHEKESYRWIESLQTTSNLCAKKKVITVCDRESDIFEYFVEAKKLDAKILLRATHDRILFANKHQKHENLWPYMKQRVSWKGI